MPEIQKNTSHVKAIAFVDYKPAELKVNSQWLVVYYCKHPITGITERFRVSVPVLSSKTERIKHGKKIALEINKKLDTGWLPYYSNTGAKEFKTYDYCATQFIEQTKKEVNNNTKRIDTLRSYTSFFSMIGKYVKEKEIKLNMMLDFNSSFVVNYLDWIYYDRENSPRTYNNHLLFIGTFVNYCVSRGYLKENFTTAIVRKKEQEKKRQILTIVEKEKLKSLKEENFSFFVLCMGTYFCFLRRTEMTKLKVSAVFLNEGYIFIDADISKNGKSESITIPNAYLPLLAKHLATANNNDYLFSGSDFKTGTTQLKPKKISDTWDIFRKEKNIANIYQFYSLKDTGITDLLNSGVPAIKVRDQARHYDLKITEGYTARNKTCDEIVRNSNFDF